MNKRFIITLITLVIIGVSAAIAIFFAKGYTVSTKEKRIVGTGIITVTSEPDGASVYIDGHLTTATNTTVSSLSPRTYLVKLTKEGFIAWEKSLEVKEGLVKQLKVTLFPSLPTIYPLTFNGVVNPKLSPDGDNLAFIVPEGKKAGIWVWSMRSNQPISFVRSSEPHQILSSTVVSNLSDAILRWTPDSKQVLATLSQSNFLLDADKINSDPRDITAILPATEKSWEDDVKVKETARIQSIKNLKIRKVASDSAFLNWAPDETKFMARKEAVGEQEHTGKGVSGIKVYDLEEGKEYSLPAARLHLWLPDSRHIILVEENSISVLDFDGTNKAVIYAGNFEDNFVFPWPDSSRLVFISSFPTPTASEPNLYGINLR